VSPIWERCTGCDDYVCNVHRTHTHDCDCPDIDTMLLLGIDPYSDPVPEPRRA
jgi:hypothetical protein